MRRNPTTIIITDAVSDDRRNEFLALMEQWFELPPGSLPERHHLGRPGADLLEGADRDRANALAETLRAAAFRCEARSALAGCKLREFWSWPWTADDPPAWALAGWILITGFAMEFSKEKPLFLGEESIQPHSPYYVWLSLGAGALALGAVHALSIYLYNMSDGARHLTARLPNVVFPDALITAARAPLPTAAVLFDRLWTLRHLINQLDRDTGRDRQRLDSIEENLTYLKINAEMALEKPDDMPRRSKKK